MQISWSLDSSDSVDVEALVGDITIEGDAHDRIHVPAVYVESWLIALFKGLDKLRSESTVHIDLIEEPDPLTFRQERGTVALHYKSMRATSDSYAHVVTAVRSAAALLLQQVPSAEEQQSGLIRELRAWIDKTSS